MGSSSSSSSDDNKNKNKNKAKAKANNDKSKKTMNDNSRIAHNKQARDDTPEITEENNSLDDSSSRHSSVFSKGRWTYGTGASSTMTGSTRSKKTSRGSVRNSDDNENVGKPLRVLDFERLFPLKPVVEEEGSVPQSSMAADADTGISVGFTTTAATSTDVATTTAATTAVADLGADVDVALDASSTAEAPSVPSNRQSMSASLQRGPADHGSKNASVTVDQVESELRVLEDNLVSLMDDIHQNVTNISKAVIQTIEFFKRFLPATAGGARIPYKISMARSSSLRSITKVLLHFLDNLLASEAFSNSRAILIKRYLEFLKKLNVSVLEDSVGSPTLPCPKNFCIDEDCGLPNQDRISLIIEEISRADHSTIADQEGAFIAPVLRGLNKNCAVLTIIFGLPSPQQEHHEMVRALYSLFPDVHFLCIRDYIKPCADVLPHQEARPRPMEGNVAPQFIPPYRLATDALSPPISMSLSSDDSTKMTGTLGGYLYPQIDKHDAALTQFSGSTFAITCAHVVLSESQDYPHVSVPSRVLQAGYKKALCEEAQRYAKGSQERAAFENEVTRIEENLQWQDQNKFGQVVWGERSIVNQRLSDFAIFKVNPALNCANHLGDALTALPDPSLRFQNLHVKEKVLRPRAGTEVFKVGATTRYTSGCINGAKLVYWADGKIQSSEFVIASPTPLFATGGDSGAWILTKLDGRLGLGVVGMLHSYDGEQKQFGLFSSIGDILERLHSVTGVHWDIDKPSPD